MKRKAGKHGHASSLTRTRRCYQYKRCPLPNCLTDDHVKVIVMAASVHCKVAKRKTYAIKISYL